MGSSQKGQVVNRKHYKINGVKKHVDPEGFYILVALPEFLKILMPLYRNPN